MTERLPISRHATLTRMGMTLLGLAGLWYLVAEAVSAVGFPGYSYALNWISDLGVPEPGTYQGRTINSQLAVVMNTGFVGEGLLFLLGALAIFFAAPYARKSLPFLVLAVLHAIGISLVGLVNGSQENQDAGLVLFHFGGAVTAIVGGNVAIILLGTSVLRDFIPRWLSSWCVWLGVFGLLSLAALIITTATGWPLAPLWERGSVYTVLLAELFLAATALRAVTARPLHKNS